MIRPGLGMFTVHNAVGKDMMGTFRMLAGMGYGGIEFYGEPSDFEIPRVHEALRESGLALTSWHIEWRNLQPETLEPTLDYLCQVGCGTAIVPCLGGKWNVAHDASQECKGVWLKYIDHMNILVEALASRGLRLGYHNHEHEFLLSYDGQTVFDLLWKNLDPRIVMEFDTGNCIEGGHNPKEILLRYPQRRVFMHLKPYSHSLGFDVVLGDKADENDWNSLLAPDSRVEQYLIESESTVLPELVNAQLCLDGFSRYAKEG